MLNTVQAVVALVPASLSYDVVVQQRPVVHQLHGHGGGHAALGRRARGTGREQGQGGPQCLAAATLGRVALGVGEAEVIRRNLVYVRRQPTDGRLDRRAHQVPGQGHTLGHHSSH